MSPSSGGSKPSSGSSNEPDSAQGLEGPVGDGFVARFERAVSPYAHRFVEAPAVRALSESLPIAFGVVALELVVLFALIARRFAGWPSLMAEVRDFIPGAIALASVVMVIVLSSRLDVRLKIRFMPSYAIALIVYLAMMPRDALEALFRFVTTRGQSGLGAFATALGASGIFTAIIVSLAVAGAIVLGQRRFGAVLGHVVGAVGVVLIAGLLSWAHFSLAAVISAALSPLATLGDSLFALAVITAIEAMLWLVGIHGPALLAAIVFPVYLNMQFANTSALGHHEPIPHIVVVSTFLFVFPGGAGATLPLVLLLMRSRVTRLRRVGFATILPALVNVNEPVIFGLPLAYNPVLAVPFVVSPVVLSCTTYLVMALGWVQRPLFYIPSSVPAFVNVFVATLDWRACVLVAVNLVIAGAIWLPFVRVYERTEASRAARAAAAA